MSIITKILIVEHNLDDIELIERELKNGGIEFISEIVQNEQGYRSAIKDFIPDIILSDYSLPSFAGQIAFEIREEMAADTPFIFVSGSIGEEKSIECIKNGVTDYALKDKIFTLNPKVKRALKEAQIVQQKKVVEEQKEFNGLKLERQNNELIKTNSELDQFVYNTTHDLRSPLNSILGLSNLIEKESKELHTLEYAKMIKNNVDRLDDFIKDLLNYAQNTHSELAVEIIPVQQSVQEIVASLHNIPGAEGIHFKVNIDEQQPFYADRRRFNTVLENLISNAIKYHKQDITGRYIEVSGKSEKEHLHLSIQDNGVGIAQAYHEKIFEMFFRLPGKITGSGFGLYIVKETIEKLQGSIQINSEEGKGTSFTLKIKNFLPIASQ